MTKLNTKHTSKNSRLEVKPEWTLVEVTDTKVTLELNGKTKEMTPAQFESNWNIVEASDQPEGPVIEKISIGTYEVKSNGEKIELIGKNITKERSIITKDGKEFFKYGGTEYEVANTTSITYEYTIGYTIKDLGETVEFYSNGKKVASRKVKTVEDEDTRYFSFAKETYFLQA